PGGRAARQLARADAGGGAVPWTTSVSAQSAPHGVGLSLNSPTIAAGSPLTVTLNVAADAVEGDAFGFVVLTRGADVRRVPYWLHVEIPKIGTEPHVTLSKPGVSGANTAGKKSLVSSYRYPDGGAFPSLGGPEQVFQYTVKGNNVANLGAVVLTHAKGVTVSPRLVVAGDENRLTGYT